jgi:hypothetical protein
MGTLIIPATQDVQKSFVSASFELDFEQGMVINLTFRGISLFLRYRGRLSLRIHVPVLQLAHHA